MPGPSKPKRGVWIIAVMFLGVLPSSAQQTDELQKQLQQLKQQYEQTTRELQERIAALEEQVKKESEAKQNATKKEGIVSAAEEAKKVALGQSNQTRQTRQGQLPSEPTYQSLRDAETKIEKLEEEAKSFEFHGYVRSG
jgi:maltoporin